MNTTAVRFDRSAIFRDAWGLARKAASAAGEAVRAYIGNALRAAWRFARADRAAAAKPVMAPQPVQQQQANATLDAPRTGFEFEGRTYASAKDCYFAMMAVEEANLVSRGSAFTYARGLLATELATGQRLSIDAMCDRFCTEDGANAEPAPEDTLQDDATLAARREAVVAAGMIVEPHRRLPFWKVGFSATLTGDRANCTNVDTEAQAVEMAEEMLRDYRASAVSIT